MPPSPPCAVPPDDLVVRALLAFLERGETTVPAVEEALGRHLVAACPACRERAAAAVATLLTAPGRHPEGAAEESEAAHAKQARAAQMDARRAGLAVARLRPLELGARLELVQREHYDFRGAAVGRAFLAEALAALPASPAESAAWAELAQLAIGRDRRHYCRDAREQAALEMRIELYRSNALRCRGWLDAADALLQKAVFDARQLGLADALFWAEAKSFGTAIRRARRDFAGALREAHFSAALWLHLEDTSRVMRSRLQIASIHEQLGEYSPALAAVREALALPQAPEGLWFDLRHAEVLLLARSGQVREAASGLALLAPEYPRFPRKENFRLWTVGLIAAGLERSGEAEEAFRAARDGFLTAENPYDAALVTLDWSLFLLDQDRPEELLPLAVSMGQAFEALGVARETLASWTIFQTAAERRELTRAVAESLVRTLGEERTDAKPKA